MARNRSISVILRAEVGQYTKAMADAAKSSEKLGADATKAAKEAAKAQAEQKRQAQELVNSYQQLGAPLMAVGGAMTAISVAALKTGISYNTLQQQSRAAMTTLLGDAKAANAQMDQLDEFARSSPFSKATFITAQQQMLAFGIETKKVLPYLDSINDAVAASGGSSQMLGEVAFVMAQISAAGKITGQDLIQFGQRGINAAELIGSQMGKTGAQIRDDITNGALGADDALDALAAGMSQRFDGAADSVKNTFMGALDRVSAAWRDFSSTMAEPLVGKESGGLGVAGLNKVADLMRDFQDLPEWLQLVTGGTFAITGAATLAAGALLMLAPRIVATKAALAQMSPATQAAVGHVGALTKAVAALGAAFTVAAIAGAGLEKLDRMDLGGIESFTAGILDAGDGIGATLEKLATIERSGLSFNAVNGLADAFDLAAEAKTRLDWSFASESGLERGTAIVEQTDAALAKMVSSGNAEKAAEGFAYIASETGRTAEELEKSLPKYADALKNLDNEQRLAATSGEELHDVLGMTLEEFTKRGEVVSKQASEWFDFAGAVDAGKGSLRGFLDDLNAQAKALEDLTANAIRAGELGLKQGIIDQMAAMGPAGAQMLAEIVKGGPAAVAETEKTFSAMEAASEGWIDSLGGIPGVVETTAKWNDAEARRKLQAWKNVTSAVNEVNIVVNAFKRDVGGNADGGIYQYADGGIDERGNRVPRVPQVRSGSQGTVMWGEPETGWEAYISGKAGMEDRNRAILALAAERLGGVVQFANGGVNAFANGGFTEAHSWADYLRLQARVRDLRAELKATEKYGKGKKKKRYKVRGLDRQILQAELKEELAELNEQKKIRKKLGKGKEFSSAGAYNKAMERKAEAKSAATDFMGNFQLDKLSSPAAVERYLTRRLSEMAEFTSVLGNLKGRGASPWLLNELVRLGPNKGTIRLGKKYLADHQALLRVNALADQAQNSSAIYGSMTTHANWSNSKAANVLTTGQQNTLIDYTKLAQAMAQVQVNANVVVGDRQAATILQTGSTFAGAHS